MTNTVICGDALTELRKLPSESVHCCVTSPPYWGLRDYGVAGQLGLERTPEEYVERMVEIFAEVRRVLRSDGTCWINLGDSYNAAGRKGHGTRIGYKQGTNRASANGSDRNRPSCDLKPKDLIGIPWRVAFALQADGWYLRSEIIWHKPNPMPESVTDRPTKAHEQIFLLAKSERYFYDAEAIQEPASPDTHARYGRGRSDHHKWADGGPGCQTIATNGPGSRFGPGVNPKCVEPGSGIKQNTSFSAAVKDVLDYRNKRSVWTVAASPFKGAHFATFPPALIEPCIKAGCPAGGTVLDPFAGSGTTLEVAHRMGCNSIGIELNPEYCKLIERRIAQQVITFHSEGGDDDNDREEVAIPEVSKV